MVTDDAVRGQQALENGDFAVAIEYLSKALAAVPSSSEVLYQRGVAREIIGQDELALDDFSEAIRLSPDDARFLYSRAITLQKVDRWDDSYTDLQKAATLSPEDFIVLNALAQILLHSPNPDHHDVPRAVALAEKACEVTEGADPICLETLSQAYKATGRNEEADDILVQAVATKTFPDVTDEIKLFLSKKLDGRVHPLALGEVVPVAHGIDLSVWNLQPNNPVDQKLIFTTGMSTRAMPAEDRFRFIELCMLIPSRYEIPPDLQNSSISWPWLWLRSLAFAPSENGIVYGEPFFLVSPQSPPQTLAQGTDFAAFLMLPLPGAEGFQAGDGRIIEIITVVPIYAGEYLYGREHGAIELIRRLDEGKAPMGLAPGRPDVSVI